MSLKKCIVSFATNDKNFPGGIYRIKKILHEMNFDGMYLHWIVDHGKFPEKCPSHQESPWGFKAWCFQKAQSMGFDLILWFDSSVVPVNVETIFDKIEKEGCYFVRRANQIQVQKMVGHACSDDVLEKFGLTRENTFSIPQISTQRIGLNMQDKTALQFLKLWQLRSLDGISFKGYKGIPDKKKSKNIYRNINGFASKDPRVIGHRHDQTIASILVHQLGIPWSPENDEEAFLDKKFVKTLPRFSPRSKLYRYLNKIRDLLS